MSEDITAYEFSSRTLYYEMGYDFSIETGERKTIESNFYLYLLLTSLILDFLFGINQTITLIFLLIVFIAQYIVRVSLSPRITAIILLGALGGQILDHLISQIQIPPGRLFTDELSLFVWILEITWVLLFGVQFLITFQPVTNQSTPGKTLIPLTPDAVEKLESFQKRVAGSEFHLGNSEEDIDIELLRDSLVSLVKYLLVIVSITLLLDLLLWDILGGLAGGSNLPEVYFVSGLAFILFVLLFAFSGFLYAQRSEDTDKTS